MNGTRALTALAALAALSLAGCGSSSGTLEVTKPAPQNAPGTDQTAAKPSQVRFVRPGNGSRSGSKIRVRVRLKNFVIDKKDVGKAPRPGYGHLHFVLDGGRYDYPRYSGANGRLGKSLGVAGTYSPSFTPGILYCNVPPGRHRLKVYLANNNHTLTGVEAETTVVVR
jgi:predicted small lipoprotein YifL